MKVKYGLNFKGLLFQAREGRETAVMTLLEMYKPLLIKNAIVNGRFEENLYQELCITLLKCVRKFRV